MGLITTMTGGCTITYIQKFLDKCQKLRYSIVWHIQGGCGEALNEGGSSWNRYLDGGALIKISFFK
jgi:hypothetical protein